MKDFQRYRNHGILYFKSDENSDFTRFYESSSNVEESKILILIKSYFKF